MRYADRLRAATDELVKLKQWRPVLLTIKGALQMEIDLLPRRRNLIEHAKYIELTEALRIVDDGFNYEPGLISAPTEGVPPILEVMATQRRPGLTETDLRIEMLEAECRELRVYEKRWPTPDTKVPHRYTGRPDKTRIDGRYLVPDDVVLLTETQAEAMRDRFELAS